MNKHDNYEDALFNLLMEEISLDYGDEYLTECDKLNSLEDFENEEELLKLGEKTISRELGRIQRQKVFAFTLKSLRALSAAAVIALILCAAAYLTIPKFQHFVRDNLIDFPQHTEVTGSADSEFAISGNFSIAPPEDYEEVDHTYEYTENGIVETITYTNPQTGMSFTIKKLTDYPKEEDTETSTDNSNTTGASVSQDSGEGSDERVLILPPTPTPDSPSNHFGYPVIFPKVIYTE